MPCFILLPNIRLNLLAASGPMRWRHLEANVTVHSVQPRLSPCIALPTVVRQMCTRHQQWCCEPNVKSFAELKTNMQFVVKKSTDKMYVLSVLSQKMVANKCPSWDKMKVKNCKSSLGWVEWQHLQFHWPNINLLSWLNNLRTSLSPKSP